MEIAEEPSTCLQDSNMTINLPFLKEKKGEDNLLQSTRGNFSTLQSEPVISK